MLPGVTTPGFVNLQCDPATNVWSESEAWTPKPTITLYDPLSQCCALPGEPIHVQWSDTRNRWEPAHPHGLHRPAQVVAPGGITPGSAGQVEIYAHDARDLATLSVAARQIRSMTRTTGTGASG